MLAPFPRQEINTSRPVSRVLSRDRSPRDGHSSGTCVTTGLKLPTREQRGPRHSSPIWNCSRWGLTSRRVATTLVRSYRTISTLPAFRRRRRRCVFCSTFRRVAPPSRYEAPRPVEPGLSSISRRIPRPSGLLVRGSIAHFISREETAKKSQRITTLTPRSHHLGRQERPFFALGAGFNP